MLIGGREPGGTAPVRPGCTARIRSASLSQQRGRWHVALSVELPDLNVAGMVHTRRLARAISGLSMAELRRQVEYKAAGAGARVVVADRWYPSSKTCSACGAVRAKLTLAERQFVCEACDTRIDRDLNAAMNLARLADEVTSEASYARTENEPAGNPCQTAMSGNGTATGKAPLRSQRRPREAATP